MGKKKWYLPSELVIHNSIDDIWLCVHGKIFDVTPFVRKYISDEADIAGCGAYLCKDTCVCKVSMEIKIMLAMAGKDVSHWFKDGVNEYVSYMHAVTTTKYVYAPHGTWPQLSGIAASTKWRPPKDPFWFDDQSLVVGCLTENPRPLKIINTLTGDTDTIEVCEEETIYEIMQYRYLAYNRHFSSYTWTYRGRPLALDKSLSSNSVVDDRHVFQSMALSEDTHVPSILLYYNDDCTEDCPDITPECNIEK